jgi:hypothetical protein
VPKDLLKKARQGKNQASTHNLQAQISDFLFPIARDHPEVIGEGYAETHLALVAPKLKGASISDAAKSLEEYAGRLEKLDIFTRKTLKRKTGRVVEEIESLFDVVDFITEKEVAQYGDEYFWDDECGYVELSHRRLGCEVVAGVHFYGDKNWSLSLIA